MAITYPLTPPSSPGPVEAKIYGEPIVAKAQSPFTGASQVQVWAGQLWGLDFGLPPMERAAAEEWNAFKFKLNGMQGTFLMGPPGGATPRGVATGSPLVMGAAQSGNLLITDGWTAGVTGILKTGDFISLGSGVLTRLYKVLEDANSNGSGQATLLLWPSLRSSPGDNDPLTVNSPKGHWRLASNSIEWSISTAMHYGLSLSAQEAI